MRALNNTKKYQAVFLLTLCIMSSIHTASGATNSTGANCQGVNNSSTNCNCNASYLSCMATSTNSINSCLANDSQCLCNAYNSQVSCYGGCLGDTSVQGAYQSVMNSKNTECAEAQTASLTYTPTYTSSQPLNTNTNAAATPSSSSDTSIPTTSKPNAANKVQAFNYIENFLLAVAAIFMF